jgi:chaperonin GroES
VVAAGTGRIRDDGTRQPPDVKAGDRILFGKYVGARGSGSTVRTISS